MWEAAFFFVRVAALTAVLLAGCAAEHKHDSKNWVSIKPPALQITQSVPNPGRGFYDPNFDLFHFSEDDCTSIINNGYTLAYAYGTWLPGDRPLTNNEIKQLQEGFDMVRRCGIKLILRFRYSENGDANWSIIKDDLDLLAPLITQNVDVIAVLQAGFLGRWGEWHCWQATEVCHEGEAEKAYVLNKLLGALEGSDVQVAVRYPPDKARYLGSIHFNSYGSVPPPPPPVGDFADRLGGEEQKHARIAHHNDCFLSSKDDVGTYPDEPRERIDQWRNFVYAENEYLFYGGESCQPADADDPERSSGALALTEIERAHVDYLNVSYHPEMLAAWKRDGVYEEIAARLGYRLVIEEAEWRVSAAKKWRFRLTIRNDGFSRLKRRYNVGLVLAKGRKIINIPLGFDLRRIPPSESVVFEAGGLPPLTLGRWRLGLSIRDPAIPDRAEYGIRFANKINYDGVNWFGNIIINEK